MCYLVLAPSWAVDIEGYTLIRSSKIKDDLLVGEKTIEATLTKLKKLELIDTKLAKYEKWSPTQNYRTVKITLKGQKYNLSYHKPKEYAYTVSLEEKIQSYEAKNEYIKDENIQLKLKLDARDEILENQDTLTQKALEVLKNDEELKEKIENLEKSLEEARLIIKANALKEKVESRIEKDTDIDIFRKKTIKKFSRNAKVLCNGVDGWAFDVKFFINSYNHVSVKLLTGEFKQLTDNEDIIKFWEWLFKNQERVGKIALKAIDDNIMELMSFEGKIFLDKKHKIKKIEALNDGVIVVIENLETKNQGFIQDKKGNKTLEIENAISALKYYICPKIR